MSSPHSRWEDVKREQRQRLGLPSWKDEPSEDDLQAATDYLSLCGETTHATRLPPGEVQSEVQHFPGLGLAEVYRVTLTHVPTGKSGFGVGPHYLDAKEKAYEDLKRYFRNAPDGPYCYKAKDILRASRLPLLPKKNPNVQKHLAKWKAGEKTSPVLLRVRPDADARPLEVADGYHRVCAAYWVDENSEVRCFLV